MYRPIIVFVSFFFFFVLTEGVLVSRNEKGHTETDIMDYSNNFMNGIILHSGNETIPLTLPTLSRISKQSTGQYRP